MEPQLPTRPPEITDRQLEVARLVAEGRTNPEIAADLDITLDGAKYHVTQLLTRLDLGRREEIGEWYRAAYPSPWNRVRAWVSLSFAWLVAPLAIGGAIAGVTVAVFVLSGGDSTERTVVIPPVATVSPQIASGEAGAGSTPDRPLAEATLGVPSLAEQSNRRLSLAFERSVVEVLFGGLSIAEQNDVRLSTAVKRIDVVLWMIRIRVGNGEMVDAYLLRDLTEVVNDVARRVEAAPAANFRQETVISYLLDTAGARDLLDEASVEDGQEQALLEARRAVVGGVYAASRFLGRAADGN